MVDVNGDISLAALNEFGVVLYLNLLVDGRLRYGDSLEDREPCHCHTLASAFLKHRGAHENLAQGIKGSVYTHIILVAYV